MLWVVSDFKYSRFRVDASGFAGHLLEISVVDCITFITRLLEHDAERIARRRATKSDWLQLCKCSFNSQAPFALFAFFIIHLRQHSISVLKAMKRIFLVVSGISDGVAFALLLLDCHVGPNEALFKRTDGFGSRDFCERNVTTGRNDRRDELLTEVAQRSVEEE